jgi:hypothetical protein
MRKSGSLLKRRVDFRIRKGVDGSLPVGERVGMLEGKEWLL